MEDKIVFLITPAMQIKFRPLLDHSHRELSIITSLVYFLIAIRSWNSFLDNRAQDSR